MPLALVQLSRHAAAVVFPQITQQQKRKEKRKSKRTTTQAFLVKIHTKSNTAFHEKKKAAKIRKIRRERAAGREKKKSIGIQYTVHTPWLS